MGATKTGRATSSRESQAYSSRGKRKHTYEGEDHDVIHGYYEGDEAPPPKKRRIAKPSAPSAEKRLRRSRSKPPQSFEEVYQRALTQRFFVLSRKRRGTPYCPEEVVEITGSTGNIYKVTIAQQPRCTCPHSEAGNQCKHQLYVLSRVLQAKFEYVYQLALLSTELQEIFARAPPIAGDDTAENADTNGKRKPLEGDCPICFCEMDEQSEGIVWCRAACGQNIHKVCFETWAKTKRQQGANSTVTCPYCRSTWEGDEDMVKKINKKGKRNSEGYVNVADQLGISQVRDMSSYSRWWSGHPESYRHGY
ncbi:ring finger domain-containing protein [Podospora australis]|uniref:Ring finger domain-containing protein n=1 Tax=Podospora australis TaxID=1536484 RepID=A0AAN6WPN1_9PEZI|nr:ring finger domain-containing protein [Podospora australis]